MTIKPTFEIVLFRPEIPPNTGNIIRLCANTGSRLHLIRPLGFDLSDKSLRRAGLDYKKNVEIIIHNNLNNFFEKNSQQNIYMFTKFGNTSYEKVSYKRGDFFLFGSESKGFTDEVFKIMKNRIKELEQDTQENGNDNTDLINEQKSFSRNDTRNSWVYLWW